MKKQTKKKKTKYVFNVVPYGGKVIKSQSYWYCKHSNGEIICWSEGYQRTAKLRRSIRNLIDSIRDGDFEIVEDK